MNFLKTTVASLLLFGSLATAGTFEQNGVKEGNDRISVALNSIFSKDKEDTTGDYHSSGNLILQYGRFLTDDIELSAYTYTSFFGGQYINYQIAVGANYYFLKTPTLTPYMGIQYYYTDTTKDYYSTTTGKKIDMSSNGDNIHLGLHKFFTEDFAISPEVGARFFEFTDYTDSYGRIYLTYFFN